MTAKPNGSRPRKVPTSNLEDPEEFAPFAKCYECRTAFYNVEEAKQMFAGFHCSKCGAFMDTISFSLECIKQCRIWWRKGK